MTPRDELLNRFLDKVIDWVFETSVKHAICKGHDRDATYDFVQEECKQSLWFINSSDFDLYCKSCGYDPKKWRGLVCEEVLFKLPLKNRHLTVQIPIEECV